MKQTIKRIKEFIKGFKYLLDQLFKRSNEELAQELESLYAEHNDLLKKQNLLYEKLAEVEKQND
jgi:flagellin-specific chaperone FliS